MASIKERNGKYCVIYSYYDENGNKKQKWETYKTKSEAKKRKKELEYRESLGRMVIPKYRTLNELLEEYVSLYGKYKWAMSSYQRNNSLIDNYIAPIIGETKIRDINTRFLELYYQKLQKTPAVPIHGQKKARNEFVGPSTIRDIHKLLSSCFKQAVKWEQMEKNPAQYATVPKYKSAEREIWTAETLMYATEVCEDEQLKLAINLAFAASLRIGELCGLTWKCVDISPEAIEKGEAYIYVDKEFQRVSKEAVKVLGGKDIIFTFPSESQLCKTVRVLKKPKTDSSIRKVFIPKTVAEMLIRQKEEQKKMKDILGPEYQDYDLVMATPYGSPVDGGTIRKKLDRLIDEYDLPDVVFHSLRHTSVTYKLKLNGGDIKAVQGDSGHSQINMVTDVYSHIIDEDRKKNAELFEEAFYGKKNLNPQLSEQSAAGKAEKTVTVPEGVDAELLAKVLGNPEMMALLTSLAKTMNS